MKKKTEKGNDEENLCLFTRNYSSAEYWSNRYEQQRGVEFEWYLSFSHLKKLNVLLLHHFDKISTKILILGSGNSTFSNDLYDDGFFNITNIDCSFVVLQQMKNRYSLSFPLLSCFFSFHLLFT